MKSVNSRADVVEQVRPLRVPCHQHALPGRSAPKSSPPDLIDAAAQAFDLAVADVGRLAGRARRSPCAGSRRAPRTRRFPRHDGQVTASLSEHHRPPADHARPRPPVRPTAAPGPRLPADQQRAGAIAPDAQLELHALVAAMAQEHVGEGLEHGAPCGGACIETHTSLTRALGHRLEVLDLGGQASWRGPRRPRRCPSPAPCGRSR